MRKILALLLIIVMLVGCGENIDNLNVEVSDSNTDSTPAQNETEPSVSTQEPTGIESGSQPEEGDGAIKQNPDEVEFYSDETGQGFIDPDGRKVLLSDKYDYFYNFYDGRMVVFNMFSEEDAAKNPYYFTYVGIIDLYGNVIVNVGEYMHDSKKGSENYHYENGGLIVRLTSSNNSGVIDINGEYILDPIYKGVSPDIIAGRRLISYVEDSSILSGYLDEDYNIVIPLEYQQVTNFVETENGAYAIVCKSNMRIYKENSTDLAEDHLFNYAVIDINNNILYEEKDLIYCDFFIYRDYSSDILSTNENQNYTYAFFDKSSMVKKKIDINGMWTNNYDASFFVENPQWLLQIEGQEVVEVYVWDENTKYEIKEITDLLP